MATLTNTGRCSLFPGRRENKTRLLTPLLTADPAAQAGADHLRGSLVLHPALAEEVAEAGVRAAGALLVGVGSGVGLVDSRLDVGDHTGACA